MTGNLMPTHNVRYHSFSLKGITPTKTPEGFYTFQNVKVARTGLFPWTVRELQPDGILETFPELSLNQTVYLQRDSISEEAINSLRLKPLTLGHPERGLVTPTGNKDAVGSVGTARMEDEWLVVDEIIVYSQTAIDALESGTQELSIGYTYESPVKFVKDLPYIAKEVIIYINHVAIVDRGRAGPECRFNEQELNMNKDDELLAGFHASMGEIKAMFSAVSTRLNALEKLKKLPSGELDEPLSENSKRTNSKETGDDCADSDRANTDKNSKEKKDKSSKVEKEDEEEDNPDKEDIDKDEHEYYKDRGDKKDKKKPRKNSNQENDEVSDITIEKVEEFCRENDMFFTGTEDMQYLLKGINTNGLIGLRDGKAFNPMQKTRINALIEAELALRKLAGEEPPAPARINSKPESQLFEIIGI